MQHLDFGDLLAFPAVTDVIVIYVAKNQQLQDTHGVLIIPMTYIFIINFKSLLIGIISSCSPSNMGAGPEL